MLYSIGKDSSVMLHLAQKAFYPSKPPFPLLHVDTTWKFREMIAFRDATVGAARLGPDRLHQPGGRRAGHQPVRLRHRRYHTHVMKTEALKQALDKHGFDAAFGGARRDEEKSRAKERVFSFRTATHDWDPKNQRPELWHLYNTCVHKGEIDPGLPAVQLDRARRLAVHPGRAHPDRAALLRRRAPGRRPRRRADHGGRRPDARSRPGEEPEMRMVRFRTLGCYPLTGAIDSTADTIEEIVAEMFVAQARASGRGG